MKKRRTRLHKHDRFLKKNAPPQREAWAASEFPTGWYFARFSEDLRQGEVVPVEFMSREFALFRTDSGDVGMVDSQCCHMGADLARCGAVCGEHLVCGYHAWEFGTDGGCKSAPRVTRLPARAKQEAIPVLEYAGNIWFWHGPLPARPFIDIDFAQSKRFMNIKGEVNIGPAQPRAIIEHVTDVYHFPYSHRSQLPLKYTVLKDEGPDFEFQLKPEAEAEGNIQRLFRPFGLVTMAGPCTAIYRTQNSDAELDRHRAMLTMILGVSPVREGVTLFTWRVAVRKLGPDFPLWPVNRAFGRLLWWIIRRNVHADRDILGLLRTPERTLWVRPDGPSMREFREFYERNMPSPRPPVVEPSEVGDGLTHVSGGADVLTSVHPRERAEALAPTPSVP